MPESNIEKLKIRLSELLNSNKPKIIAGTFTDVSELTDEQLKHFKTAEYIYNQTPITIQKQYRGFHVGVLLDDTLNYFHLVVVSKEFINQTSDSKIF